MQMSPMTCKEYQETDGKNYTTKMLLEKVLLMALGFFTISTELRLLAGKGKEGEEKISVEFKEA